MISLNQSEQDYFFAPCRFTVKKYIPLYEDVTELKYILLIFHICHKINILSVHYLLNSDIIFRIIIIICHKLPPKIALIYPYHKYD